MSADIVNLRAIRKRAERRKKQDEAAERRVTHGTPKALRLEIDTRRDKAARELDGHQRDTADE